MKHKIWQFLIKAFLILTKFSKGFKALLLIGSFAAYSYLYNWQFAIFILFQLFVHEYGHIWAMKKTGMKIKGIYFIPFLGGAAVADEDFKSRKQEAFIAIMGPVFGVILAVICYIIFLLTNIDVFGSASIWMLFVNLFNLLPINPMDGGRILKSIAFSFHKWFGFTCMSIGLLLALFICIYFQIWLLAYIIFIGILDLLAETLSYKDKIKMTIKQSITYFLIYVVFVIGIMCCFKYVNSTPASQHTKTILLDK